MESKLTEKDRKVVTGAAFVAIVIAALLAWGYVANQRKAAEPKPAAVELAEKAAKAAQPAK